MDISTKKVVKNILLIVVFAILLIGAYWFLLFLFENTTEIERRNEFGDYIGGILNPLFTLLSTAAIIYLTYIIANNEDKKSEKSIETQKRITLSQMRQMALNDLIEKMNLFVYEADKLSIHDANKGKLHQKILTKFIEEENEKKGKSDEKVTVWLIILLELENFFLLKYLFLDLFETELFLTKYNDLIEITSKLAEEQAKMKFITYKSIGEYINNQKELVSIIGNYIYSEF
ncbi:hypothetical protein [Tenacibaculum ascidiaceicola]|uniref:hypothetical protein n=1 Tax=Tenacibaculum ascidiaceicola TaxID=1699411 RepID=UPI003896771E